MRTIRALATTLAFCLLFLPAALGGAAPAAPGADADYRGIFVKASQNLLSLKSYHMSLAAEGSLVMDGRTMGFVTDGQADIQTKPMLMKNTLTATMDAGGKKNTINMAQYVEETGDKFVVYSFADNKWARKVVAYPGGSPGDYRKYFDAFARGIAGVKLVKETDDALVLEAAVSAGYLQEALEQAMSGATGRKVKLPESLFDNLGDFKYTAVIIKESLQISELTINMADFVSSLAQAIIDTMNLPDDQKALAAETLRSIKLQAKISLSRYNAVEPIAIPREAKNAPPAAPPATPEAAKDGKSGA